MIPPPFAKYAAFFRIAAMTGSSVGLVLSGRRSSTPCAAARSSIATIAVTLSAMS